MAQKQRADLLVAAQGLASDSEQATRMIMAGQICADTGKGRWERVDKPGQQFAQDTIFAVSGVERFVSRGAYKLLTALEYFALDVHDCVCLDAGASTGGFTDCLLQHGAQRVYAVDVGHAQLHERLQKDPRVISREGVNLRTAPEDLIPEAVSLIVADVSFISLTKVLPHCVRWLSPQGRVLALIKPQFELGSHQTVRGVVRDTALQQLAVDQVLEFCLQCLHLACKGVVPSALKGPKGNQEYLALFERLTYCEDAV